MMRANQRGDCRATRDKARQSQASRGFFPGGCYPAWGGLSIRMEYLMGQFSTDVDKYAATTIKSLISKENGVRVPISVADHSLAAWM